ncbi:hypothetical protein TraAM80_02884 [Trypanosoma rangeli]|uniref:Present in the outer mitochondrial membrane proteome 25 n=1 Tax=Trypanosoma rangeli TaxID=5698 RepID=A0A422NRM1_TRYRA|nr:uncharacterized protein TraAM80_02884 [Trypanosoma rangeli]RNF08127.1 hypothetical protein TraAM80_02884 [Trypanosoma rangeli]|eukprot:RNF08127.1 hypothetical protein TraAM80_02884 [Trypanosoma rangeli]
MFATAPQSAGAHRGAIYAVSAALSSAFVAWAVHKWWKQRYRETGDEGIFDDIEESPLFDLNVMFPAKSTVAVRASDTGTGVGGAGLVSIAEREEALRMARHLVSQLCGEGDDAAKGSEGSASSDEETNVSLNYRIATELEREARDGLVATVVHGELLKMQAQGNSIDPGECEKVLRKLVEYFDISNEREKLRGRRIALHQAGAPSNGFPWANTDGYNDRIAQHMAKINERYGDFFSREGELEQRLRAPEEGLKERFEVGWGGDDDDDDDADFMDYLDEDDAAGYGSRMEYRMGAAGRENLQIMGVDRGMLYGDEEEDGEFEEEEEDSDDVDEKAGFERMLLDKLRQLAASIGERTPAPPRRTGPMAVPGVERHAGEEEEGGSEDEWETASDEEEADGGGRKENN